MTRPLRPAASTASSSSRRPGDRHRLALGVGFGRLVGILAFDRLRLRLLARRAFLSVLQRRRLGVGRGLLCGERVQLARLGGDEEARLDDVRVGHAAPQPLEQIAALGRDFAATIALRGRRAPSHVGDLGDRLGAAGLVEVRA